MIQLGLRVHVLADTGEPPAEDSPKGGAHDGPIQADAEQVVRRLRAAERRIRTLEIRLRRGILGDQLFGALEPALRQIPIRLRPRHLCLELGVVDLEERRAGRHELSFPHQDVRDAAFDLGPHVDGLDGFDLPGRGDGVNDGIVDRGGDLDRHRRHSAGSTGATGTR